MHDPPVEGAADLVRTEVEPGDHFLRVSQPPFNVAFTFDTSGSMGPYLDFVLDQPAYKDARILVAGENFGCGSSREHAPWALVGWGLRAIISTGFADIFKSNSLKNGLLPVEVSPDVYKALMEAVQLDRSTKITIDLPTQSVTGLGSLETTFPIDAFSKHCLLEGIDQLGYLLSFDEQITSYEQQRT